MPAKKQHQGRGHLEKANGSISSKLGSFSEAVTRFVGSSWAFTAALAVILIWGLTGSIFHYSDTWQLVINTGTTIVTFLMVFLIQRFQNKESLAVQLKLNEIVAAIEGASNRLIDVESLAESELLVLRKHYQVLAQRSKEEARIGDSHSIEEAEARHAFKVERRKGRKGKK
ncbi:MAG TPA: low affinity iron permease family protein [Thermoanaerobaculia bacterium]|nr:low affinity iron permease family protein [Thermoanaerobaculia bacterium]